VLFGEAAQAVGLLSFFVGVAADGAALVAAEVGAPSLFCAAFRAEGGGFPLCGGEAAPDAVWLVCADGMFEAGVREWAGGAEAFGVLDSFGARGGVLEFLGGFEGPVGHEEVGAFVAGGAFSGGELGEEFGENSVDHLFPV